MQADERLQEATEGRRSVVAGDGDEDVLAAQQPEDQRVGEPLQAVVEAGVGGGHLKGELKADLHRLIASNAGRGGRDA